MALNTTPGTIDADSYVTLAEADAYHAKRGEAAWAAAADTAREAALIKATAYLDASYRFDGDPLSDTQALAWPRTVAADIPQRVKDAQCELAIRALSADLMPDSDGRVVTAKSIGPIKTEFAQVGGARFPLVDALLRDLLAGGGRIRLVRA
ncbi:MAG: hypothetical protein KBE25_00645 [Laribacter sp.]|nr:hypothetical protein [Laribacter sp.]MBP9607851.1 hypothetical protein [Laribacter sp.]